VTHTFATLTVSAEAYDEIAEAMRRAGYTYKHLAEGQLDIAEIAFLRGELSTDVQEDFANEFAGGNEQEERTGPYDNTEGERVAKIELHRSGNPKVAHFPIVPGTFPCVLYFNTQQDRDGFAEEASDFDPGLQILGIDT